MSAGEVRYTLTSWAAGRPALERLRRAVFIDEQGVAEADEWDAADPACVHVLATLNREPVGTGRLDPAGKIGRLAVQAGRRGQGIGTAILQLLLQEAGRRGIREPWLHAQLPAVPFYERFGFRGEGEVFDEAGIPHRRMKRARE